MKTYRDILEEITDQEVRKEMAIIRVTFKEAKSRILKQRISRYMFDNNVSCLRHRGDHWPNFNPNEAWQSLLRDCGRGQVDGRGHYPPIAQSHSEYKRRHFIA